jgi:hypothetical protein
MSPFDEATWILMVISLAMGSIIWLLMRRKQKGRSATQFALAVYGIFFGQDIQMTYSTRLQKYLFQLFVVAFFILGLCYESLIVSVIFTNRDAQQIRTFEELKNTDLSTESSGSHKQFLARLKGFTVVNIEPSLLAKKKPIRAGSRRVQRVPKTQAPKALPL